MQRNALLLLGKNLVTPVKVALSHDLIWTVLVPVISTHFQLMKVFLDKLKMQGFFLTEM